MKASDRVLGIISALLALVGIVSKEGSVEFWIALSLAATLALVILFRGNLPSGGLMKKLAVYLVQLIYILLILSALVADFCFLVALSALGIFDWRLFMASVLLTTLVFVFDARGVLCW